jgi:hypothetical protein
MPYQNRYKQGDPEQLIIIVTVAHSLIFGPALLFFQNNFDF